jgi:hypothetical protein
MLLSIIKCKLGFNNSHLKMTLNGKKPKLLYERGVQHFSLSMTYTEVNLHLV